MQKITKYIAWWNFYSWTLENTSMFVSISDPNVCDDGWFLDEATRTCYQATNFEVYNATEAILACKFLRPMGSTLAEPRTVELQGAVIEFIQVLKIRS